LFSKGRCTFELAMERTLRRREFIKLVGAAAAMGPVARHAAQAAPPLLGFMGEASPSATPRSIAAFRSGLAEIGYAEDRNLAIDWRLAMGEPRRLRTIVTDLVDRHAAVIVTATDAATVAAKAATAAIPIVFLTGSDPMKSDLAGGNLTGLSWYGPDAVALRLALIRQLAPKAASIGFIADPRVPDAQAQVKAAQEAAATMGLDLVVLEARSATEIDAAFARLGEARAGALIVGMSAFFASQRSQLAALATRHAVPAIYSDYESVAAGGLIGYGHSVSDAYRRAGVYAGWILNGAKPSELPPLAAAKFELIINLKAAKALALDVPQNLRAAADEMIE
jgi:putative ABC transport system substrate-binding protein